MDLESIGVELGPLWLVQDVTTRPSGICEI